MKSYSKKHFPVDKARRILEPGPTVLVASAWKGRTNIMTMGWHTIMEFKPSLLGCVIASSNHSFEMIRKSGECTINVPMANLVDTVVAIGNCSGDTHDKFTEFDMTAIDGTEVAAPTIGECFASFECRISDKRMIKDYNFFILEIVAAHVASSPRHSKTIHYHGQGIFTEAGQVIDRHKDFSKWKGTATF